VALSVAALPVILPVNYVARGHEIVFRTSPGSKLDAASRHNVVAFEVDSIDPVYHEGWSVLATGRAEEITDPRELAEAAALPLQPWAPWVEHRFVKITAELISGRRLRHFAA
jgi:nitroimidazol reductase NimA-like FMN-containing flavoprotein (pyridoxamine 5'-phosphate oxidase superfamily)